MVHVRAKECKLPKEGTYSIDFNKKVSDIIDEILGSRDAAEQYDLFRLRRKGPVKLIRSATLISQAPRLSLELALFDKSYSLDAFLGRNIWRDLKKFETFNPAADHARLNSIIYHAVLQKLAELYQAPNIPVEETEAIQLGVLTFVEKWITLVPSDFESLKDAWEFSEFCHRLTSEHSAILQLLQSTGSAIAKEEFLVSDPELRARKQIKVKVDELMSRRWETPNRFFESPNISKLTEQSNFIYLWVTSMILQEKSTRRRVRTMEKVIALAKEFRNLNNFLYLAATIGGLNSSAILRLKTTRDKVSSTYAKSLKELEQLISVLGSFKNYRSALQNSKGPAIPLLAAHLKDLYFIEEGNPESITLDMRINWGKHKLVYQTISTMFKYQQGSYDFSPIREVKEFIDSVELWNEDKQHSASLDLEPHLAPKNSLKKLFM